MILRWFISRKEKSSHQNGYRNGYDYVKTQYEENPTKATLMRLMDEQQDEFGIYSFNLGMDKAIVEIILQRKLINEMTLYDSYTCYPNQGADHG